MEACSLAGALRDALSQHQQTASAALIAYHNGSHPTASTCVSVSALRVWITASVAAIVSPLRPCSSLVVAIALPPCSAEESAMMLLVASQPYWTFVPLDVRAPLAQLEATLQNVGADVVVTWDRSGLLLKNFTTSTPLPALFPSALPMRVHFPSTVTDQPQSSWREKCASPPLYVLPTSGTTGRAKGVVGTRTGAVERVVWSQHTLPMDPQCDVVLRATRLTFVDAVAEILGAILSRVPLVHLHFPHQHDTTTLVDSVVLHSPRGFCDVVAHWRITRFTIVPSVLRLLLHAIAALQDDDPDSVLASVQVVLVSGESLPLRVVDQFFRVLPHVALVNLYGSTEVSGDVTWKMLRAPLTTTQREKWGRLGVPIGESPVRAIGASTQIRLERDAVDTAMDAESLRELWVRGGAVAAGYVVDKQVVRPPEKWVCESSKEWFRMGDLCRVVDDELFLRGRRDRQVKIRGHRLQLEDVERAVKHVAQDVPVYASVCDDVIVLTLSSGEDKTELLAILVVHGDLENKATQCSKCPVVDVDFELKRQLYGRLVAEYGVLFVPHAVVVIEASKVPRHSNGKVHLLRIRALFEDHNGHLPMQQSPSPAEGPLGANTRTVGLALVCEVLGLTHTPDLSATWLQLGGNSLQAALFSWEADRKLKILIPAHEILQMEIQELLERTSSKKRKLADDQDAHNSVLAPIAVRQRTERNSSTQDCHRSSQRLWTWYSRYNQSSLWPDNQIALLSETNSPPLSMTAHLRVKLVAQVDLGKCIDASPLITRHKTRSKVLQTFIGSHSGEFVCLELDARTHKSHVEWTQQLDDRIEATATISVTHALVIVGTYSGRLYALELETGAVRWEFQARDMIKSSAIIVESLALAIVGAYDQCLYGLDLSSGAVMWTEELPGSVFSTPVFVKSTRELLVATTSGVVMSWRLPTSGRVDLCWKMTLPAPVFASLVLTRVAEDRNVVVGCADGVVYALDLATGSIKWTFSTSKPIFCTPSVYHTALGDVKSCSAIVGSHDGKLRKISTVGGALQWEVGVSESLTPGDAIFASPFVATLRQNGGKDSSVAAVCAATTRGRLVFLEETTGRVIPSTIQNSSEPLGEIFSSPVVVDDLCFVGTRSNLLLVFHLELVSPL